MRTAPAHITAPPATPRRHLTLVRDVPRPARAPRIGRPQRIAAAAAGLVCGSLLGAWATILGGGDPAPLMAAASLAAVALFIALVACRAGVRRRARVRVRTTTAVPSTVPRPVATAENVVPLRRAA